MNSHIASIKIETPRHHQLVDLSRRLDGRDLPDDAIAATETDQPPNIARPPSTINNQTAVADHEQGSQDHLPRKSNGKFYLIKSRDAVGTPASYPYRLALETVLR